MPTVLKNTVTNGEENRRSDMIWAIINKYYHNLKTYAVSFPVYHHRYVNVSINFSLEKTISEIRGAALYGAMFSFLQKKNQSEWELLINNSKEINKLYCEYIDARLTLYAENFQVINELLDRIQSEYVEINEQINTFISTVKKWVSMENFKQIKEMVDISNKPVDVEGFLKSINGQIDSFKNYSPQN